jgi:hypothetical protein
MLQRTEEVGVRESHFGGEQWVGPDTFVADATVVGIAGAVADHRRRMARLLEGLDALPPEASGMPVAALIRQVSHQLRAGEDRLGLLIGQLEGRPSGEPRPNKERHECP